VVSLYYLKDNGLEVPPAISDDYFGPAVLGALFWLIAIVSKS
jgi:hypothetical protein